MVSGASAPMLSRQTIAHVLKESEAQKSFRETKTRLVLHREGIFHGNRVSIGDLKHKRKRITDFFVEKHFIE